MAVGGIGQTAHAQPNLQLAVKSAILIEAETGKILYKYNENLPLPPASMTKMMTEYLVLEAIKQGKISWDDRVTTDEYGFWMGRHGGSRVFLNLGEVRTVRELYTAMAVYSANDATVMLAKHVAGSEAAFVEQMNKKAKELGMTHTHFVTSTGFPAKDIPEQYRPPVTGEHVMSRVTRPSSPAGCFLTIRKCWSFPASPRRFSGKGKPIRFRCPTGTGCCPAWWPSIRVWMG